MRTFRAEARSTCHIRPARVQDAAEMGRIHVESWQSAYRRIIPPEALAELSLEARRAEWKGFLTNPLPETATWVAEIDGQVVGFMCAGPSRDADLGNGIGEAYVMHVDPRQEGRGAGRGLFGRSTEYLRDQGYRAATLWVVAGALRARRMYERAGWHWDGSRKRKESLGQAVLHEVRYRIDYLGPLLKQQR